MNDQILNPSSAEADKKNPNWERELLEKLATDALREQRLRRRWGIFFKFVLLFVVMFGFYYFSDYATGEMENLGHHTALIEIDGSIESEGSGSAQTVIPALNRAFADPGSVAVVVRINSPGGSPVQAGMINDEMGRLRKEYPEKKLYVVVDEICASGGYYIAVAADKIYVNKASIVGSIGVLMDGFGFTGIMDKLGVERRLMTAGENKGFMDPFSPQTEKQKAFSQGMLNEIHQQFIDAVRTGRGQRLKETPEMFSGLFWIGTKAVQMGLADDFGSVDSVARDVIKVENIVDYTQKEGLPERVLKKFGASIGSSAATTILKGNVPNIR
ncbi:S49 family peptidase [Undibacterium sp. CY18W]|uniref:S49 family peptidase n=1 Tax=Undibacterium hunanense TaxID=2762292 RepID=A0ABR6ZK77_9BURK|nr:S49 family peptidase [Undibacterium hunanense]MBC3916292.1 S49 family peptidase [Undibacterium hunanense]